MRKILQRYPLHPFLLVVFLIVFLYAQNHELVKLSDTLRTFFIGSLVTLGLFLCIYLLLRQKHKSAVITTSFLFYLFNYGVVYDLLEKLFYKGYWPFSNIHRYLLLMGAVYLVLIFIIVKRKKLRYEQLGFYLNTLFIVLILINILKVVFGSVLGNDLDRAIAEPLAVDAKTKQITTGKPNLYYIVLDGYANNAVLEKYYDFKNEEFNSFLLNQQFQVSDSSYANYYSTLPSLCATFNMEYHKLGDNWQKKLNNNLVFSELKKFGYKLVNLESGYSVTKNFGSIDSTITIISPNEFERSILKYSILRLDDLFGIMQHARLKNQIDKLNELGDLEETNTFYFIHLVAPHPPYVFDENGNQVYNNKSSDNSWEPRSAYINQLKYINTVITRFLRKVISKKPNSAFIIQSDHGPWITSSKNNAVFESRSMIFNAVRFPNRSAESIQTNLSSVNTFRQYIKLYHDSTIYLIKDSLAGKTDLLRMIELKDLKHDRH